jgi:hypothetical protein
MTTIFSSFYSAMSTLLVKCVEQRHEIPPRGVTRSPPRTELPRMLVLLKREGNSHKGGDIDMIISVSNLQPVAALIAGILILVIPRLLNFIVAIYLIIIGILGLAQKV